MSWTDKELSEMAKAAQAEQKFAYQDSFWNEVEAMLPAKKKKGLPFFWLALVPVVAALGYWALSPFVKDETRVMQAAKTIDRETLVFNAVQEDAAWTTKESALNEEQQVITTIQTVKTSIVQPSINAGLTGQAVQPQEYIATVETTTFENNSELVHIPLEAAPVDLPEIIEPVELTVLQPEERVDEIEPTLIGKNKVGGLMNYPISTLPKLNLTEIENKQVFALEPLFNYTRKNFWNGYVEAGFSMGQSYMTSQVGHTSAFNLGLGARYDFKNYFVQLGLQGELQNVKFELTEREKIYHTSSTVLQNNYSYKQLYRVEAPLTFGYQFPKHLVQISVIPSYLAGAKMRYEYLENGTSMRNETMYETEPGTKTAWNDFSTSFGLGYGYRLTKTIALGANLKWQLMNQLNSIAETEGNVRPLSGQVFIRKTLK